MRLDGAIWEFSRIPLHIPKRVLNIPKCPLQVLLPGHGIGRIRRSIVIDKRGAIVVHAHTASSDRELRISERRVVLPPTELREPYYLRRGR